MILSHLELARARNRFEVVTHGEPFVPKILTAIDKTKSLVLKYQSLVIKNKPLELDFLSILT